MGTKYHSNIHIEKHYIILSRLAYKGEQPQYILLNQLRSLAHKREEENLLINNWNNSSYSILIIVIVVFFYYYYYY